MSHIAHEIQAFCSHYGLKMNTDLGQHFLIDEDVLETIMHTADIQATDEIIEIGPGIGVLTRELLKEAKHVTAIEFDARLIPLLQKFVTKELSFDETRHRLTKQLTIIQANALHVPLPETPYKIVANIPYHITSPLFRHAFLESKTAPTSLTLLIQREVAETICSTKDAGMLTVIVGLFGTPHIACRVPPSSFLPPPKVDSAVLHVECYPQPKADSETIEEILKLTKIGFGQKRKMLRNTIGAFHGGMERLSRAGIAENRRPQTLSIEEWISLAQTKADA